MTSSSIASSEVVASNPRTSRAFRTSGTRIWTSCSKGGSDTCRKGRSDPLTLRQIVSASSRTVVLAAVDRLKSSLRAAGRFHRHPDPPGEVAAVGVVPDLVALAQDVERVLPLEGLEHEVRDDVAQRELDIAAHHVGVADRPPLADADAVERPEDRVGQPVLLVSALGEILAGELLEAVRGDRRRARELGALGCGEDAGGLVDHRRAHHDDPLEAPAPVGRDRRVEGRRQDALVLGDEVVGELVEVADPPDHRRGGDHLVAVRRQPGEQVDVLRIALDEAVAWVVVVRAGERAVLAEVVDPDDFVPVLQQVRHEVAVDEPGGAGDEDLHSRIPSPSAPQTSTTSLPVSKVSPR